jgi:hypothetical protein
MRWPSLRALLAETHLDPDERRAACAERCMEALYDAERAPAVALGEREQAEVDAERRRWDRTGHRAAT